MYLDAAGKPDPRAQPLRLSRAPAVPGTVDGARPCALANTAGSAAPPVMAPAIALARDGFRARRGRRRDPRSAAPTASPTTRRRRASFCARTAAPYRAGDRLVQPDLAATLDADRRARAGRVLPRPDRRRGRRRSAAHGGILTAADFAAYTVTEMPPIACAYRGYGSSRRRRRAPAARSCARC